MSLPLPATLPTGRRLFSMSALDLAFPSSLSPPAPSGSRRQTAPFSQLFHTLANGLSNPQCRINYTAKTGAIRKAELVEAGQQEYVRKLLEAYRATPGTTGVVRRPDRQLAAQLYKRGVPLIAVDNALVLAAARRMARPPGSPSLATIRSLAYFSPVIEEVLQLYVKTTSSTCATSSTASSNSGRCRLCLHSENHRCPRARLRRG